jgi:hypothetical protein
MMKKFWALLLTSCLILTLAACGNQNANSSGTTPPEQQASQGEAPGQQASEGEAPFHIGIVTGTVSQSEDEQRGAEAMIAKYGDADSGGYIRHLNYPDNFMQEQETTIQQIASLADDPLMKVIVVNQSVPGTTAAFKQIREKNPDIILLAGNSQEDTAMIESAADFVADPDNTNRGYLIPLAAQKMGAKTFVHVSFPRHMSIELLSLRKDIMEATCEELGIKFVMETAPDPMSDVGIPGAQQFILEKMPAWVEKYGKDTAFFVTNDAHTEPTLKKVAELGAIFVEQDLPSPILGYPGAFGIDLKDAAGNWPEILKRVESAVDEKGGSGRMGTWAFSFGFTTTQALAEFGKQIVEGTMSKDSLEDLIKAYEIYTPDAAWNGSLYVDRVSGDSKDNHAMVYQDTYVFGEGYLGMTDVEIPDVYKLLEK